MNTNKILVVLSLALVAGCANLTKPSPTWPTLEVIQLKDGGICLDAENAKKLARLRAQLENH